MIVRHFDSLASLEINPVLMKVHKQESLCNGNPPMPPSERLSSRFSVPQQLRAARPGAKVLAQYVYLH